jgi:hypothetical protein
MAWRLARRRLASLKNKNMHSLDEICMFIGIEPLEDNKIALKEFLDGARPQLNGKPDGEPFYLPQTPEEIYENRH